MFDIWSLIKKKSKDCFTRFKLSGIYEYQLKVLIYDFNLIPLDHLIDFSQNNSRLSSVK